MGLSNERHIPALRYQPQAEPVTRTSYSFPVARAARAAALKARAAAAASLSVTVPHRGDSLHLPSALTRTLAMPSYFVPVCMFITIGPMKKL